MRTTTTTTNNISRRSILQMLLQILWHRGGGVAVLIRKFREHSSIFNTATLSPWTDTFQHMFCLECCPHRFNQELTRFQKTISLILKHTSNEHLSITKEIPVHSQAFYKSKFQSSQTASKKRSKRKQGEEELIPLCGCSPPN